MMGFFFRMMYMAVEAWKKKPKTITICVYFYLKNSGRYKPWKPVVETFLFLPAVCLLFTYLWSTCTMLLPRKKTKAAIHDPVICSLQSPSTSGEEHCRTHPGLPTWCPGVKQPKTRPRTFRHTVGVVKRRRIAKHFGPGDIKLGNNLHACYRWYIALCVCL